MTTILTILKSTVGIIGLLVLLLVCILVAVAVAPFIGIYIACSQEGS